MTSNTPEADKKAKELYDKFYNNCTMTIAGAGSIWKPLVKKQCELCVQEIIKEHQELENKDAIEYWQSVLTSINSL